MSDEAHPDIQALKDRIGKLHQARGYLLPHHGAMAVAAPDLQEAYLAMYRALTLTDRHLSPFEREAVWIAILIAAREAIGTHHVELFLEAGGSEVQMRYLTKLCAFGLGVGSYEFMDTAWSEMFPSLKGIVAYREDFEALLNDGLLAADVVHLALAALHAASGNKWGLRAHIRALYELQPREDALVEALSLIMWPVGVNHFLDACGVWVEMMKSGEVTPSERFRVWADLPRQDGHDASHLKA
ncbi:hypothetical protein [Chelativorans sp. Marseille-P2723]|uniref:hypothetical protein n=1 Tax=Chelativorans sp. Marseille-P2723 TaxID=2709133 RepID=UPI00156E6180|nr:hypothetical protein [Chelativorans sp. Marseille-P2723]